MEAIDIERTERINEFINLIVNDYDNVRDLFLRLQDAREEAGHQRSPDPDDGDPVTSICFSKTELAVVTGCTWLACAIAANRAAEIPLDLPSS